MLRSNNTIPPFSLTACDLICPRSSVHKRQNCVPLIIPSLSPSLFFYAIFFPASIPTLLLLLHLLLLCGCYDNSSTAPFICWRPGLLFLYRECAPLTSIHNTLSANAVTEAIEELTSLCLQQRLPVPLVSLSSSSFFFCPLFISFWRRLLVTCQLFTLLPSQRFHLCVPPPSLSPVTHWLLRSSFFLPFFLPSRFPPPLLAPPVTAIAARLRIIYRNWSEQAASPLKPVAIASEGKPGGKVEGDLVCFSALLLPCFACRRIFSYAFSFFSFFFLVFLFFFFLFDELVIVQGGSRTACVAGRRGRRGAGAVLQPSGMRDLVWEWWAQPHPLLLVSFLHLCSQTLFHPLTQPPTLTTCHLLLHLSLHGARLLRGAAAGSNDVCKDTGLMGGVQESNFSLWNDAFVKDVNSNHSVGSRACESTRVW